MSGYSHASFVIYYLNKKDYANHVWRHRIEPSRFYIIPLYFHSRPHFAMYYFFPVRSCLSWHMAIPLLLYLWKMLAVWIKENAIHSLRIHSKKLLFFVCFCFPTKWDSFYCIFYFIWWLYFHDFHLTLL